jgi:putative flavoprotein involved in K+ transport
MNFPQNEQHFDTIVIGGGQAGLAVGYALSKQGRTFLIIDANKRIGAAWSERWDSLRLFSPAWYDSLPGMPFPAPADTFPTKDDMAAYLQAYVTRFDLPVWLNTRVETLTRERERYIVTAGSHRLEANHVVVATGAFQHPTVPAFASELSSTIVQLHSYDYRKPGQLQEGEVLIVGAGNSGAEIAMELAGRHSTWLAGRDTGHIPLKLKGRLFWWLFGNILTVKTPLGRKLKQRALKQGGPLIRLTTKDLDTAGVQRVSRVARVQDGKPVLEDGRGLDVANVIWCTGFVPDFSWIDLPILGSDGYPLHDRGIVETEPGLFFIGLPFQYGFTSSLIGGVGRDATYIAERIAVYSPEGGAYRKPPVTSCV